jgi:hypothetical protein
MNYKRLHIFNGIIFLVLLIANVIIYKNRDNGYAYTEYLSYKQLYQSLEVPSITKTRFNGTDSLTLCLSHEQNNAIWNILLPDSTNYTCKGNPVIKLQEGIKDYQIQHINSKAPAINIRLNYVSEASYKSKGRARMSDVELMQVSIPISDKKLYSINHWTQSSEFTTDKEIALAKQILTDSMNVVSSENTISKIQKIGGYIYKKLNHQLGTPNDSMDALSPLQQFVHAKQSKSEVWCGNYTSIFSFFANTAGITTRSVWIEGEANGISTAGHNFNECYIKELNQWIFVDLMSNTLSLQTKNGSYLNSLDFYNLHQLHSSDIMISSLKNDSIVETEYDYSNSFYNNYFNPNVNFVYYYAAQFDKKLYNSSEKIKRYISKQPTFATYSNASSVSNAKFYKKQMALLALFAFSIYWVTISVILKFNSRR